MDSKTLKLVAGGAVVGLLAASGLAVYFSSALRDSERQRAVAQTEVAQLTEKLAARPLSMPGAISPPPGLTVEPVGPAEPERGADEPRLQEEIHQLREHLRAQDDLITRLRVAATNAPTASRRPPDRGQWLADLKESDPERYQEIMQRREERTRRANDAMARKSAHFLNTDTTGLTEEEQVERAVLLELLDTTWDLAEQLDTDLPRDQRRELHRTLRENMRQLEPLLESERDREFFSLGLGAGYSEEEATVFVDYINDIIDLTSMRDVWRNTRGGPGRGGPERGRPQRASE